MGDLELITDNVKLLSFWKLKFVAVLRTVAFMLGFRIYSSCNYSCANS